MDSKTCIIIGGFYNLGFAIFHIFFWKIFEWKSQLRLLNFVNKGLIQIFNLCLIVLFLFFAFSSIFYTNELIITSLGRLNIFFISLFWFLRAAYQIYFFGIKNQISLLLFIIFMFGGLIYLYPFL